MYISLSIYLIIYLSHYLSISLSIYQIIYIFHYQSISLSINLYYLYYTFYHSFIYLSIHLNIYLSNIYLSINVPDRWDMKVKTGGIQVEPRIPLFCDVFIRLSIHISSYLTIHYLAIYLSIIYLSINLPDRWDMKVKTVCIKVKPWIPLLCVVFIRLSIYVSSYLTIHYLAIYLSIIYLIINLPDRWDMKVKTGGIQVEPRIPLFCDVSIRLSIYVSSYLYI